MKSTFFLFFCSEPSLWFVKVFFAETTKATHSSPYFVRINPTNEKER